MSLLATEGIVGVRGITTGGSCGCAYPGENYKGIAVFLGGLICKTASSIFQMAGNPYLSPKQKWPEMIEKSCEINRSPYNFELFCLQK